MGGRICEENIDFCFDNLIMSCPQEKVGRECKLEFQREIPSKCTDLKNIGVGEIPKIL